MKVIHLSKAPAEQLEELLSRGRYELREAEQKVKPIIERVKKEGDKALRYYTQKFDGVEVEDIRVGEEEVERAIEVLDYRLIEALEKAAENIREFHKKQIIQEFSYSKNGRELGIIIRAIPRVGCYIPGGRASYPSTVLMTTIPAKVAGVRHVVVATPPNSSGEVNPLTLAACKISGVDAVYRVGGAQAIAALAYGTESVKRVDKIVGPGNIYVTAAKRIVSQDVAIDMPAGPSEVLIIADNTAEAERIAWDMLAQAEHDPNAISLLVTTSEELAGRVGTLLEEIVPQREEAREAINRNGVIVVAQSLEEAVEFANKFAPEHLQIVTSRDEDILKKVENAGSIFLGGYTPVACGDYASGTNHVLPTAGFARAYSGLNTLDFLKIIPWQRLSRDALERLADVIIPLAEAEGLFAHAESVKIRLRGESR